MEGSGKRRRRQNWGSRGRSRKEAMKTQMWRKRRCWEQGKGEEKECLAAEEEEKGERGTIIEERWRWGNEGCKMNMQWNKIHMQELQNEYAVGFALSK